VQGAEQVLGATCGSKEAFPVFSMMLACCIMLRKMLAVL
jgi:hypothetical protein